MKSLENLSKKQFYVIGVSGGPDSMALLDLCRRKGLSFLVAHMNYQKRETALRDEEIVKTYCARYAIPCYVKKQNKPCKGNFQAFARKERYHFYQQLLEEHHGDAVLLAHHLDDHLETYLMQQERGSPGVYYGIQEATVIYGCRILRPLMMYTKQELLAYCIEHQVPYGFDESNFTDDYARNRIRHMFIDNMNRKEKDALAKEIDEKNQELLAANKQADAFLASWQYDAASLMKQPEAMQRCVLRTWIYQNSKQHIAKKLLEELLEALLKANNWTRDIGKGYCMSKEYGLVHIHEQHMPSYAYVLDTLICMDTPYFHLCKDGKSTEALTLYPQDFPITIRNVEKGDAIELRFGRKKVHRWFIDRKIPSWERKRWPVVVNAQGNVILVPQIGCDIAHFSNNPSIFVVK